MSVASPTNTPHREPEWESGSLDLDAYLTRIGHPRPNDRSVETLRSLQRAHLDTIPFENLDVVIGAPIRLDLASLQDKLVGRRRGGYCHEHNTLFATVLDRLGFDVRGRSARMLMGKDERIPTALSHTCLAVAIDGVDWHVDVGVGNPGPRAPIPLKAGIELQGDGWTHRLDRTAEGRWLLRYLRHDGWFNLYQFSEEPFHRVDFADHNYIASTHPDSHFVRRIVAQRNGADIRHALTDCELKVVRPGAMPEISTIPAAGIPALLREIFGLDLPTGAMDVIVERARSTRVGSSEVEPLGT